MKRILIFSLTYHPHVGGAEIAIKEITDRLGTEYEFHMVTLRFDSVLPRVEKLGNVLVHRIGPSVSNARVSDRDMPLRLRLAKILFPFSSALKATLLDWQYTYDGVWAMMANQAGFGALFFSLLHPRTPYVLELQDGRALHDMKARRPILYLLWPLYRLLFLSARVIKVISSFLEREVRSIGYEGTVAVIPNAVDVAKFSAPLSDEVLAELKSKYGKKLGDTFLFSASRLVLSRGVEDVIRALPLLPASVTLLVAGTGEDEGKLRAIARESDVENRVIFAGHIGHDELPAYYKMCDIFVRPSLIEGFGNAFVEAFAAGIPVVATPVGGIPDFLFDPEANPDKPATGLFSKPRDPASVAAAVKRYMADAALRAEVVQHARALAAEKYDWATIAADMRKKIFVPLLKRG